MPNILLETMAAGLPVASSNRGPMVEILEENELISPEGVADYMKSISRHKPRGYQIKGVYDALKFNRKLLIFGDESGRGASLKTLIEKYNFSTRHFCGFFIGPEGGFSGSERLVLGKTAFAEGADFGPRILRSETAVVAALSAWHALTC